MRCLVLGLDSVPPALLFDRMLADMPFFAGLMETSVRGPLRSCDPPITVPAWMVLASSRSPERLGSYGFKERQDSSYTAYSLPRPNPELRTLWKYLGERGRRSCLVGVPPGYPPYAMNGCSVSCLLTPPDAENYTYPPELRSLVAEDGEKYIFDIPFRKAELSGIFEDACRMTRQRLSLLARLWRREDWPLAFCVDMAPDRLHHAFWRYCDPEHPRHEYHPEYSLAFERYYRFLDAQLRLFWSSTDLRETAVLIVSDHGSQPMKGCFAVNEWLRHRGYLKLKAPPRGRLGLESCEVDWPATQAWAWGGYYARIFINQKGREPQGCVSPESCEGLRRRLGDEIRAVTGPDGALWDTKVTLTSSQWAGRPADLHVEFDDLRWRAAATLGHDSLYLADNDTGPDGAVHSRDGVLMALLPGAGPGRSLAGARLTDIAPTVLSLLGEPVPSEMEGRPLF